MNKQFVYKVCQERALDDRAHQQYLNKYGEEGYELVSVVEIGLCHYRYFLKKEKYVYPSEEKENS